MLYGKAGVCMLEKEASRIMICTYIHTYNSTIANKLEHQPAYNTYLLWVACSTRPYQPRVLEDERLLHEFMDSKAEGRTGTRVS
jgi:hypothetical protein